MMDAVQNLLIIALFIIQIFQIRREIKMWGHIKDLWGRP